jgi:uroporphyrin-III C-methyltransferase/precorrin-2 dehydrogenase/sirohydrochlorin ferrochelatase
MPRQEAGADQRGRPARACDFFTPAIASSAPLAVAVASEGGASTFASRAGVEAMLAPVRRSRRPRRAFARPRRPQARLGGRRRRFTLLSGVVAERVFAGRSTAGGSEAHPRSIRFGGHVSLVGDPGAEDLLTLRAQRALQEADGSSMIASCKPWLPRAGAMRAASSSARRGEHSASQAEINAILVREARAIASSG